MRIINLTIAIVLAFVLLVVFVSIIRATYDQTEEQKQQQAEFCKKLRATGVGVEDLIKAGCKP